MPNTQLPKTTIRQKFMNYKLPNVGRTLDSPDVIALNNVIQLSIFNNKLCKNFLKQLNHSPFGHSNDIDNNIDVEHQALPITEDEVPFHYHPSTDYAAEEFEQHSLILGFVLLQE